MDIIQWLSGPDSLWAGLGLGLFSVLAVVVIAAFR